VTLPHARPPRHLHVFGISLLLIVGALVLFLFGVRMEAIAPATGVVTSPQIVTIRAAKSGIIEKAGSPVNIAPDSDTFLQGGTEIAQIRPIGDTNPKAMTAVRLAADFPSWLVLEVHFADGQRIQEGDPIVTVYPMSADGAVVHHPVRLEIDEKNFGAIEPGQEVRMTSNMFSHRSHGVAKGVIERLEPMGVGGPNGGRKFHAWVKVKDSPFELKLGSSVKAEVIVGRKKTYQIILEH
jgi:hypothetical protein